MRSVLLIFLTMACLRVPAQTESRIFYSQLMIVFSDLDNNFNFLKGDLKDKEENDSLFETNNTLEGTKENSILVSTNMYAYQAMINDSISEAGSQFILKAWKEKLTNALTGSFTQLEKNFYSEDKSIDGCEYASKKIIVLLLRHKADDGSFWINLVIKTNKSS